MTSSHVSPGTAAATPVAAGGNEEHKLLGIELLRFASAVAVLIFHYQHFSFQGTAQPGFVGSAQPLYPLLHFFYDYGFYGVEIFWCISGFIFFWKYAGVLSTRSLGGREFFFLRLSRLYPLHFATLLFMAVMQYIYSARTGSFFVYPFNDTLHFVLQLFMASNWAPQFGDSFNGPIWSISLEVLVYAVFFVTLRYGSRSPSVLLAIVAGSALVILLKLSSNRVFDCLMYFYLGCLTAFVYDAARRSAPLMRATSLLAILATASVLILGTHFHLKAVHYLLVLSPASIFLATAYVPATPWNERLLAAAGSVTYSSYLLHVPIQILTVTLMLFAGIAVPFYNTAFFLCYLIGTLALSYWCYVAFEMPAQRVVRRRFIRRRRETQGVAPTHG